MGKAPASGEADFDRAVAAYSKDRGRYEKLASYVCGLIRDHCGGGLIHTTEHRAKSVESFDKKCRRLDETGNLRYPRPLDQLTDLSGVRVIVFLRDSVSVVCDEISRLFDVIEQEDVGDRVYKKGKFGYQSRHLLIRLADDRNNLVENASTRDLVCEIQVRTLLQHAWAEMEHDIQYKSDIDVPLDLNKRFSALAGLLEIADREFASIQRDSEALRSAVKEELLSDLTQQGLVENLDAGGKTRPEKPSDVARELIRTGRYAEAIDLYSAKMVSEPNSYTLFIGRARARFLTGDVRGAVTDLDEADRLSGDSGHTSRLRDIIERGDDPRKALRATQSPSKFAGDLEAASAALRAGDGVKAFEHYTRLEERGYSRPFSLFGKAMACTLERDIGGARSFTSALELRLGTSMAVNMRCLECILDVLDHTDTSSAISQFRLAYSEAAQFDLELSFLTHLRAGLAVKGFAEHQDVEAIFGILKVPPSQAPTIS